MADKKKVGILGGTFNPIHFGHLILAQNAYEEYELDKVLFIPTGISHFKDQNIVLDKKVRCDMTRLAIEDNECFELSTIEIERPGNSYTCDTILQLKETDPDCEYYLIVGADTVFMMEKWMNPQLIFDNAIILASVRDDNGTDELRKKAEELRNRYNADIRILHSPMIDISSTTIREKVNAHKSVKYLLPDKVIAYIEKNGLYL